MLDPKLLRESPETVRAAIARKHLDVDLDAVLAIDTSRRALLAEVEGLRSKQKAANNDIQQFGGPAITFPFRGLSAYTQATQLGNPELRPESTAT